MRIAIIGGGAAGFAAAIAAAECGADVTVLERGGKPLKKLGVTGNGRGNILNSGEPVYYGDAAFANAVLRRCGYPELITFFSSLGVPLREERAGWIYPASLTASAVQDALLLRAGQLGVTVRCLVRAESITQEKDGFLICGKQGFPDGKNPAREEPFSLHAEKVIVACGGAAAPAHGTDGTAYGLLTAFGHRCTSLAPALCALHVQRNRIRGLAGQRVRAQLRLMDAQGEHRAPVARGNPVRGRRGQRHRGNAAFALLWRRHGTVHRSARRAEHGGRYPAIPPIPRRDAPEIAGCRAPDRRVLPARVAVVAARGGGQGCTDAHRNHHSKPASRSRQYD